MPVVSNTSPILNLAIIERLSLLQSQFDEILIPPAVLRELRVDESLPGSAVIREAFDAGWLASASLPENDIVRVLNRDLDLGESEAIALALARQISLVLLDETEGREIARNLNLTPVGTLGILLKAKQMGAIPSIKDELIALREMAGFYVASDLNARVLALAGET
jgi:predicted nucleic acid-binding protein